MKLYEINLIARRDSKLQCSTKKHIYNVELSFGGGSPRAESPSAQTGQIVLLSRSTLEPLISLDLVGTNRSSIVLGLGSIVTTVCITVSQPIL